MTSVGILGALFLGCGVRTSQIDVVQCKVHHQIGSPPDHGHGYGEGGCREEPQLGEAIETEDALGYHVLSLREVY